MGAADNRPKWWWRGKGPVFGGIADALSAMGMWCETHQSTRPIVTVEVPGGKKHYWQPWESPFDHPWRVIPSGTTPGEIDVTGGVVWDGETPNDVAALTGVSAANDLLVWLRVKYWNDPAVASEFAIESGVAWPPSDYDVDVVPDPGALTTLPKAGWCEAILRIAEIGSGGVLHQYLYEDVVRPRGQTYSRSTVVGSRWNSTVYELLVCTDTIVRGVLVASAIAAVQQFDTGPCPSGS